MKPSRALPTCSGWPLNISEFIYSRIERLEYLVRHGHKTISNAAIFQLWIDYTRGASMSEKAQSLEFIAWGGYDKGKPRVRMLLDALRERHKLTSEINVDAWRGIEDKSVAGWSQILRALLRLVIGYPLAFFRLMATPPDRIILLLYPAIVDIFIIWPLARLRRQKIVFDAFISFHDTIVGDRRKLNPDGILSRWLWHIERSALALADIILVDTDEHGRYFSTAYQMPRSKFITALVGAEPIFWEARNRPVAGKLPAGTPPRYVLFYGQLIPLHGIETILDAVRQTEGKSISWLIVGSGQEEEIVKEFVERHGPMNMVWLPWVNYDSLPDLIRNAIVSLGIFGATEKAARVIPNKMFQVLAAGGSIITRESQAVAELAEQFPYAVRLVPPADALALADAVVEACERKNTKPVPVLAREVLSPGAGIDELIQTLEALRREKKCQQ